MIRGSTPLGVWTPRLGKGDARRCRSRFRLDQSWNASGKARRGRIETGYTPGRSFAVQTPPRLGSGFWIRVESGDARDIPGRQAGQRDGVKIIRAGTWYTVPSDLMNRGDTVRTVRGGGPPKDTLDVSRAIAFLGRAGSGCIGRIVDRDALVTRSLLDLRTTSLRAER